jgi:hypothetical protein
VPRDATGHYFIDRNPSHFAIVLDIMRNPALLDHCPRDIPEAIFNAIIEDEQLRLSCPLTAVLQSKKEEISKVCKQMTEAEYKLDQKVMELILTCIDLPAFLNSNKAEERLYIPRDIVYKLDDGTELYHYVEENEEHLQGLMDRVTEKRIELMVNLVANMSKIPDTFTFDGVVYDTKKTNFIGVIFTVK